MSTFTFIIILVLIITLGDVAAKVIGPMASRLGDLIGEMVQERRLRREGGPRAGELSAAALEDLEARLARIEDRLDFIEALRAPDRRSALTAGQTSASSDS